MYAFRFPFSSLNSPTNNKQQTTDYKSGIQIYSSHDEKAIFQCNCDSSEDRVKLLKTLEDTINEVGKGEGLMFVQVLVHIHVHIHIHVHVYIHVHIHEHALYIYIYLIGILFGVQCTMHNTASVNVFPKTFLDE